MSKITVSYRRNDSDAITGRIFDRLVAHYGPDTVFRDIDNIPPGIDYRRYINDALATTDILLAIVGPQWAGRKADGLEDFDDHVRRLIRSLDRLLDMPQTVAPDGSSDTAKSSDASAPAAEA